MRALSSAELLTVWELAANQPPGQRALALLAACADEASPNQLAQLSIGESDARLLTLHERTFGPRLAAVSSCPACGETLEFEVSAMDIRLPPTSVPSQTMEMERMGYQLRFRLPNILDIASLDPAADNQTNRQSLLRRCLLGSERDGAEVSPDELPPEIVSAIAERMAEADPQADVQFALTCPQCSHNWSALFDIASYVWSEINGRAIRLLNEVHVLASAYGWREADILSMSAARRQIYLELAAQ
jgi:hypothetical protein